MKKFIFGVVMSIMLLSGAVAKADGYYNPYDGLFYGNICYTYIGSCRLPLYHPVGFNCFCLGNGMTVRGIVGQ